MSENHLFQKQFKKNLSFHRFNHVVGSRTAFAALYLITNVTLGVVYSGNLQENFQDKIYLGNTAEFRQL